ncbi:MAG: hypothetical protein A3E82_01955 [Gammaproteobacteria bacterium RIFCSPHIGHO2_12_FULL_38_11]|nr:MAG: hypothetical protein A3E82_01955 [Gammaproteobacteria bacterium RIFCSPHIGHO2_12_FULL_38_11]
MFNILSKTITPQEMLLLKNLEPQGANLSTHPSEVFSESYIACVATAFETGREFLAKGNLKKAIKSSKDKLSELLIELVNSSEADHNADK